MRLDFVKMHGLGNDFIVVEILPNSDATAACWLQPQVLAQLADRRTGIGFDQALVIAAPRDPQATASYRVFNADGSEVEQCGNGARCVAALLAERGLTTKRKDGEFLLESLGGPVRARMLGPGMVSIDMGVPQFAPAVLPFTAPVEALRYSLRVAGSDVEFGAVSVGNPHIVLEVGDIDTAPVAQLGPVLERHAAFPQRVNVGFMQVLDETHIRLRVFERGVGETRACGTGACAAVAVGRRHGRLGARVAVALPGGVIDIVWEGPGQPLSMTGPAAVAYRGQVELDPYLTWR